ncbi:CPBP family intramembrane metalloprotease [Pontibacter diazotrophicus]|uniref:CPBP family intramembrane metalloprotease n=1 Tax=Pontibacter diazotrophicus TaxID=1400979 RepID=A0A3D8L7H0_9BACT|nr:type II CAAX endopeptidase family protein [Pontibacter diazotrophicus]RDV13355.1 CPBP family intramembrane metalloprotease [Pontibacter diazotrophicus]
MYQSWQGVKSLTISRKRPVLLALISFLVYFASVVAGSIIQKALGLKLQMGWGQQIASILIVLIFASFFKRPKELLGLSIPKHNQWLLISVLTALFIITVSVIAKMIGDAPAELESVEYYIYEATMPGLGEELGLRGLVFGFLLYYAKQHDFSSKGIWTLIIVQALPFGFLHLFQTSGMEAVLIFIYTTVAAIALAWLRAKTGSVIPSIIAHNIINVFGSLIYYFLMA